MAGFGVPDPTSFISGAIGSSKSNVTAATAKMVKDLNLDSKMIVAERRKTEIEVFKFGGVAEKGAIQTIIGHPQFGVILSADTKVNDPGWMGPMLQEESVNKDSAPDAGVNQQPGIPSTPATGICPIDIAGVISGIGDVVVEEIEDFIAGAFPLGDTGLLSEIVSAGESVYEAVKEALDILSGIATAALEQLDQLAASITAAIPTQAEVFDFINSMLPDTGDSDLFGSIQAAIEDILPSGLEVGEFLSSVQNAIGDLVGDVGDGIGDLASAVSDVASGVYGYLNTGIQVVIDGANGVYTFAITEIGELVAELDAACTSVANCIGISGVNGIVEKANAFASGGVTDKITQIQDQFGSRLTDAANSFTI